MGLKVHRTFHIMFDTLLLLLLILLIYICFRRKLILGLVTFWTCLVLYSFSVLLFITSFSFNLTNCYNQFSNTIIIVKLMSGLLVFISYIVLYDDKTSPGELGADIFFLGVLLSIWSEYRLRRKLGEEESEKDLNDIINSNTPTKLIQE